MASYKVILKPSVEKDLRSLPREVVKRVFRRIERLKDDPLPRQSLKLSGAEQLYRIRVGEYRIVIGVDKEHLQVTIHHVRHRRDVYRQL
jgi:mRNA interferase RelE/StbE